MTEPAIKTREIRVFLSSTFKDMEAERNHLIKTVFPSVRAACHARRVGFTEIDLRWGVTEDESKNGATVEICLAEIDRCRDFPPFFIGFLGERYGWIPREDELAAYWAKHSNSPYAKPIRNAVKRGISVTELEMELGVLGEGAAEKLQGHALFLLRDRTLTDRLSKEGTRKVTNPVDPHYFDPVGNRLEKLKNRIRQTPFLGEFDTSEGYQTIEQFGKAIEDYLLVQLDRYFPEDAVPTPLERMQAAHAAFRFHRLQNFLPRPDVRKAVLKAMAKRIGKPYLGPILLAGPSGQGKSALLADLARHVETEAGQIHWRVIDHYVGSDEHNSLDGWLKRLLDTLHPEIGDLTGPVPESPKDRKEALATWLTMAARRAEQKGKDIRPVRFALVLDALDQLSDGGSDLALLTPANLGPDGILVVSAADGTSARESADAFECVEVPPLTETLKAKLIQDTLKRYRKKLPTELATKLTRAPQAGSPLYLGLALEELRVDARHESISQLIDEILDSPDAAHLFLHRFLLDGDYGRPELPTLAAAFMALLSASRNGLSEIELADLLALPTDPKAADTNKPRLPQVHLSKLLTAFQPFLLNKRWNRAPMHRIFGEVAMGYYGTIPVREHLYAHFRKGYGKDWDDIETPKAAEALYQITRLATTENDNQGSARKRLAKDLGQLWVPTVLHDTEAGVTLDALSTLDDSENSALAGRWGNVIDQLDEISADLRSGAICNFADWMCEEALDGYKMPKHILLLLMSKQRLLKLDRHESLARTLNSLGGACFHLNQYDEARYYISEALDIRRLCNGNDHEHSLQSLNDLGVILGHLGEEEESKKIFEAVYKARRKILGPTHPKTAESLANYGAALFDISPESALPFQMEALTIRESALGPSHPDTINSLTTLGATLDMVGDKVGAKDMFEKAVKAAASRYGNDHLHTAECLGYLSVFLFHNGQANEAKQVVERCIAVHKTQLGDHTSKLAHDYSTLAICLNLLGDHPGAMRQAEKSVEIYERHPELARDGYLESLESLVEYQNEWSNSREGSDAEEGLVIARLHYERALAAFESHSEPVSVELGRILFSLGSILEQQGDLDEAEAMLRRELNICIALSGEDSEGVLASIDNLADLLDAKDDIDGLIGMRRKQLAILERQVHRDDELIAQTKQKFAVSLRNSGRIEEAEPLQREAMDTFVQLHGDESLEAASAYSAMGMLLKLKGDVVGADPHLRKALAIRERNLGSEDEKTRLIRQRLHELGRNSD